MAHSTSPLRRRLTRTAGLAAAGLVMAGAHAGAASAADGQIRGQDAANAIPNNYIAVLDDDDLAKSKAKQEIDSLAGEHDAKLKHRYLNSVQGFAAKMSEAEALELSKDPAVAYVEQDRTVKALATQSPTPSWGLDRIDQRDLPLNNSYTYANTGRASRRTSSTPASGPPTRLRRARGRGAPTPSATATTATATGTARTWPARSAAPPTAWPRASSWWP